MITPVYWQDACKHLTQQDPALAGLIARFPAAQLRGGGDAFGTLVNSIVGQQISVRAADAIRVRLAACVGEVTPSRVLDVPISTLREIGLSMRKVAYLRDLAMHFQTGKIDPMQLSDLSDEAVIEILTEVHGIGRWTAEMFLMFHLLRPNILPLDDIGLQRAMMVHYGWEPPFSRGRLKDFSARWQPYCSVATWLLWRSLDPVPVEY